VFSYYIPKYIIRTRRSAEFLEYIKKRTPPSPPPCPRGGRGGGWGVGDKQPRGEKTSLTPVVGNIINTQMLGISS